MSVPTPSSTSPVPLTARAAPPLKGTVRVPGDKSVSHRALILGALAVGETRITGLLEAEDVLNTAKAVAALGAKVERTGAGAWRVCGVGVGGWSEPAGALDFGNSGTGSRLMMGALATTPIRAVFTGDPSLSGRPMGRVLEPLRAFGADYSAREGGLMPITLTGADAPLPVETVVTVPSAQVKSALLLAALNAPGKSRITQTELTRDHTERMLAGFGAEIRVEARPEGGEAITLTGEAELKACAVDVPCDPSSAAFPLVAALIVPGSEITLPGVLLNPRRIGLIATLREMRADITVENRRVSGGEEIGDLVVRASRLTGVEVPASRAPAMIDEYPILAVAAAFAAGQTRMRGLGELRVKESDRLAAILNGLKAAGVTAVVEGDDLTVTGMDRVPGGAAIDPRLDHRIAMAFLVLGLASAAQMRVTDTRSIATSFPDFEAVMAALGARFAP